MSVSSPALHSLGKLVGTWRVSGGVEGQIRYEWMDGGFFLIQHIDFCSEGQQHTGMEIIGYVQSFGQEPSADIHSCYYGNHGETFDYVYEMKGSTLTIWAGERGSPAYYRGTLSADGNTLSGAWIYPDGGGYSSTAVRVGEN